jgi:hypothetical protein
MTNAFQIAVLSACREFMKPVARLLLKKGIGFKEFSEVCKSVFVEVASDDYGIRGRKTNMSRVAVMTGLTRKEVRKVRDTLESGEHAPILRASRPESVLSIWHNDSEYLDKHRQPKRISFDGPGPSFKDLVAQAGGDIPPKAMLNELLRAGSVVRDGLKLRVVSRSYVPESNDPQAVLLAGASIRDLASTIEYNLSCEVPENRYLERRVFSYQLPKSQKTRFRKLARDKGELLLNDLSIWLSEREEATRQAGKARVEGNSQTPIGVGIYFFDEARTDADPQREI